MAQQDVVEVAEVLARLAKVEQDAVDNAAAAGDVDDQEPRTRTFLEGQASGLQIAQKLIREVADWPVTEEPLLVEWPTPEHPAQ